MHIFNRGEKKPESFLCVYFLTNVVLSYYYQFYLILHNTCFDALYFRIGLTSASSTQVCYSLAYASISKKPFIGRISITYRPDENQSVHYFPSLLFMTTTCIDHTPEYIL